MNRRSILKALFLGTPPATPSVGREQAVAGSNTDTMGVSDKKWHVISGENERRELSPGKPEMNWLIENGELICTAHLSDTAAFLSDYCLCAEGKLFKAEMLFTINSELGHRAGHGLHVGFRFSSPGNASDVAQHIDAGLSSDGPLFIGEEKGHRLLNKEILRGPLRIAISVITQSSGGCFAKLAAFDRSGNTLATLSTTKYTSSEWQGSIGVLSHYTGASKSDQPSLVITNFKIEGEKIVKVKV